MWTLGRNGKQGKKTVPCQKQ